MTLRSARVSMSSRSRGDGLIEQPTLPIAGTIRAGIQILTPTAAKVPELRDIYEQGVEAGASFLDIRNRIMAHPKCPRDGDRPKIPLMPSNAPYFTVRQVDFPGIPGAADVLLQEHGEVRPGDPERRLYSFPVVFPSDNIDLVFNESFKAYTSSGERTHWSQMGMDGVLKCVVYDDLKPERNRRQRFDARRPVRVRCDCEPDSCEVFGSGKCAHYGALYFWIPGLSSEGLVRLTFRSVYSKLAIYDTLTRIKENILGRIEGLYRGQPIFRVAKVQRNVPHVDRQKGATARVDQWFVDLSAPGISILEILSERGSKPALAGPGESSSPTEEDLPMDDDIIDITVGDEGDEGEPDHQPDQSSIEEVKRLRTEVNELRKARGWADDEFGEWITSVTGKAPTEAMRDLEGLIVMREALLAMPPVQAEPFPTEEEPPL